MFCVLGMPFLRAPPHTRCHLLGLPYMCAHLEGLQQLHLLQAGLLHRFSSREPRDISRGLYQCIQQSERNQAMMEQQR